MPKLTANHGKEYCSTRAELLSSTARAITVCIGRLPAHHCRLCQKPALQTLPTRAWAAPWAAPQGQDIISATIFAPTRMTAGLKLLSLSTSCPPATNASPPAGYPGSLEASQHTLCLRSMLDPQRHLVQQCSSTAFQNMSALVVQQLLQ